jgi:hypothetical protein
MFKLCVKIKVKGLPREIEVISRALSPDDKIGIPRNIDLESNLLEDELNYKVCALIENSRDILTLKNTLIDIIEHMKIASKVYTTVCKTGDG